MTRRKLIIWWVAGLVAMSLGAILIIASSVALAAHLETIPPGDGFSLVPDNYAGTTLTLIGVGFTFAFVGFLAQLMAWVGAVFNSGLHADRRWFNALLWSGIVGIVTTPFFDLGGLITGSTMIAYFVGGPAPVATRPGPFSVQAARPTMLTRARITAWVTGGTVAMVAAPVFALLVSYATNEGHVLQGLLWTSLALLTLCAVIAVCGLFAVMVGWWEAVFNSHRLPDQRWFKFLAWSGIIGAITMPLFGLGVLIAEGMLIAYLIAGPDGKAAQPPQPTTTPVAPLPRQAVTS
jgi:hypothetical protein